jgi:hypothetical protein
VSYPLKPLLIALAALGCADLARAQTPAETRAIADAIADATRHREADRPSPQPPAPAPAPVHDMSAMDHSAPAAPAPTMDHSQMPGMDMSGMDHSSQAEPAPAADPHAGHDMSAMGAMTGALGAYPMERDGSGTSWRPDSSDHMGVHATKGPWMLMGHALLNGVYDWQEGPRGGEKGFVSGMIMGMAKRQWASGDALQLRAMLSPEPFMGKNGYPILLATGETANGVDQLTDRQHPHDIFMELSASYAHRLGPKDSVFLYAGLPGEPAFGPSAFMHRQSIMDSPEAPISHHWLDSTHIVYGVVTAGYVHGSWKVEVSRYKGREPDETRFDIDHPKLDSTAVRLSWNPLRTLSLQASWAHAKDVEQLDPGVDQKKWSVSGIYTRRLGPLGWWSTTAAWGRRSAEGVGLDAWILESAIKPSDAWTLFARGEQTENNELTGEHGHHGPVYRVGKVSAGAIHDWKVAKHLKLGLGGLYAWNHVPDALAAAYGGNNPNGAMGFVRLKIE